MVKTVSRTAVALTLCLAGAAAAGLVSCASKPAAAASPSPPAAEKIAVPADAGQAAASPAPSSPLAVESAPPSLEASDPGRRPLPLSFLFMNLPEPESRFLARAEGLEGLKSDRNSPQASEKPEFLALELSPRLGTAAFKAPSLDEPSVAAQKLVKATPSGGAASGGAKSGAKAPAEAAKPNPASTPQAAAKSAGQAKAASPKTAASPSKPAAESAKPQSQPIKEVAAAPTSSAPILLPQTERQPDIARRVSAEVGSRIELPFAGTGWTFLGEREGKSGVLYESRRYDDSGLVFVLNAAAEGDYVLRFQRQDLLRGMTNEELVAVAVLPRTVAQTARPQTGPASPAGAQPAEAASAPPTASRTSSGQPLPASTSASSLASGLSASASSGSGAVVQSSDGSGASNPAVLAAAQNLSLPDTPDGLILTARNELAASRVAGALAALDRFLSLYPAGMDEVFYLYGLCLEQNGPLKDIKRAYSYYKRLRDDYPQSEFWDKAADRASYIERHYFEIR